MSGVASGIEMARQALLAHQMRLGVISHNIANAAAEGYSRQEAVLEPGSPIRQTAGYPGTGVTLTGIARHRDPYFDARAISEKGASGQYEALQTGLQQVEGVFSDMNEVGIGARLADFWQSWQQLANRPPDSAIRTNVVTAVRSLAGSLRATHAELVDVRSTFCLQIDSTVTEVNRMAAQVAELNVQIQTVEVSGQPANDLREQRDRVLESLAELSGASVTESADGMVTVRIGGRFLVDGRETIELVAEPGSTSAGIGGPVLWADGRVISGLGGKLGGLLEARDGTIVRVMAQLDLFANVLRQEVNALHDDGTGTVNVFEGTGAGDIRIGSAIDADPASLLAGAGLAGDYAIALAIAHLEHQTLVDLDDVTLNDYLAAMLGTIGSRTREAEDLATTQSSVLLQVEEIRQTISGVSLDEEAAELIVAQRAFQAAAQVVDTLDSMIETVIATIV
jgi:flagellar hook-associated protein 1 FlgK